MSISVVFNALISLIFVLIYKIHFDELEKYYILLITFAIITIKDFIMLSVIIKAFMLLPNNLYIPVLLLNLFIIIKRSVFIYIIFR
jgi:hypothetical protein